MNNSQQALVLIDDRDHVKLISGEQLRQVLPRVNASALDSKSKMMALMRAA
jgi:hypothetical protein